MSWVTTGIQMVDNEPKNFEFHNWRELNDAVKWVKTFAKKGFIVSLYHVSETMPIVTVAGNIE